MFNIKKFVIWKENSSRISRGFSASAKDHDCRQLLCSQHCHIFTGSAVYLRVTICPQCKKGHFNLVAVVLPMNRGSPLAFDNFANYDLQIPA
jgi:hypothetical protein